MTSVGTIGTGIWQGTIINPTYGGTGVNNESKTITLGGNLTTSGAFATTLASTANTNVTLPTTGTLATLANAETLTNKTLTSPTISSIVNTGTLTLPSGTDTLVGRATTDTLTNKTLTSPVLDGTTTTVSGNLVIGAAAYIVEVRGGGSTEGAIQLNCSANTHGQKVKAQPHAQAASNTLLLPGGTTIGNSDAVLVSDTGTQTLTNKTLTTPIISSISNTGTITLPTGTDTLVGRATTDTLTNKTINLSSNTLQATSAELATAISDETGTGSLVFANSPTLVTPTLGAASATSLSLSTPLSPANGGTGLSTTSAAAAGKILGVAPNGSTHEYKTLTPGTGISITDSAGIVTITNTGSGSVGGGGGSASGAVAIYRYNATAGQTVFSGVDTSTPPTTLVYTPNYLSVFLNGVKLDDSDFTATNGTSVTLNVACVATDDVDVVAFGSVPQLASPGLANYVVGTTAGGTALEYKQIVAGTGVSIAQGVGSLTISAGGSPLSAPLASFRYIASANQTVFTGSDSNGNPLGFTPGFLYVFVNGVLLAPSLDYTTTSTTTITLTSGCSLSDFVDILAFGQVTTVGLTDSSVTTAKLNQTAGSEAVTTATIRDGAVTAAKLAAGAAVPSQTGNSGKYLTTNGTTAAWQTSPVGFRNRIINGDMRIDQRNAGASVTPSSTSYTLDRWSLAISGAASKLSIQQSTTAPDGYKNSTVATVVASYSPASSDVLIYQQAIEGFNFGDLAWGTSSAQAIAISFWVRSSLIGTYSVMLLSNGTGGTYRNYIATYSISSANVWEKKTITVSGDTSGTWDTGNTTGLYIAFDLGSGSGTAVTAGSWANGVARKSTGANTFVSQSNGATWYITGVQLEAGSTATDFERRPIGTELALCQRYTYRHSAEGDNDNYAPLGMGRYFDTNNAQLYVPFKVTMRAPPSSVTQVGNIAVNNVNLNVYAITLALNETASSGATVAGTTTSGTTAGNATTFYANNTANAALIFEAEL